MPRILHIPRRFALDEWGGTESVIYNLCKQQLASGLQPEIHTSRALATTPREVWRDIPIRRYRYTYPFLGLSKADILALDKKGGNLLSLDLFWHLLAAREVRIYHAHVLGRMGGAVMTAARLRRKPFIVSLHGNIFDVPPDEAAAVNEAQQGHFEWGKPFGALLRSRHLIDEADAVLCVGFSEYERAKAALGHDRVYHLPNGVTPHAFANANRAAGRLTLGWPQDAIAFGCLSRIDPQKNQLLLVEAFAALVAAQPQRPWRLLLGGPVTAPAYQEELVALIRRHQLEARVTLHPAVVAESTVHRDLLAALDVFVLPSRHEPFGIVILEAWAAGLPVIASNIGGLAKLVSHERDGLHFPAGDAAALTSALARLGADAGLRHALATAGHTKMTGHYTWAAVNAQLEQVYQLAEDRHR
ncbi:MAG: glycosyltransferase family 4 protein [Verrucomicrobiota bacterium]